MVSDSAPGLIKLALSGLNCVSVPDLFHALRGIARPIGSAIGKHSVRLHKKLATLQSQMLKTTFSDLDKQQILQQSIDLINLELQVKEQAQQKYNKALHTITLAVHPFDIDTHQWQLKSTLSSCLNTPSTELSTLALTYGTDKATKAIDTNRTQIPFLAQGIHAWWQWVTQAKASQTDVVEVQDWVLCYLKPWFYWQQQADKTRHPELKQRYLQAKSAGKILFPASFALSITLRSCSMNILSLNRCMKLSFNTGLFGRNGSVPNTNVHPSAIEGRNGCLSRLHHTGRGFSPQTKQVLTIIHNFDTPSRRWYHPRSTSIWSNISLFI